MIYPVEMSPAPCDVFKYRKAFIVPQLFLHLKMLSPEFRRLVRGFAWFEAFLWCEVSRMEAVVSTVTLFIVGRIARNVRRKA